MLFLENYLELREDPENYLNQQTPGLFLVCLTIRTQAFQKSYQEPRIAQYARLKDYHKNFKKILSSLIIF